MYSANLCNTNLCSATPTVRRLEATCGGKTGLANNRNGYLRVYGSRVFETNPAHLELEVVTTYQQSTWASRVPPKVLAKDGNAFG